MMEVNTTIVSNIGCILPHVINEEQWMWYNDYSWWVEGFGSVLIGIIGIVLNLISSAVLLGSSLGGYFFNWLLVCLAVFDSLFLLSMSKHFLLSCSAQLFVGAISRKRSNMLLFLFWFG